MQRNASEEDGKQFEALAKALDRKRPSLVGLHPPLGPQDPSLSSRSTSRGTSQRCSADSVPLLNLRAITSTVQCYDLFSGSGGSKETFQNGTCSESDSGRNSMDSESTASTHRPPPTHLGRSPVPRLEFSALRIPPRPANHSPRDATFRAGTMVVRDPLNSSSRQSSVSRLEPLRSARRDVQQDLILFASNGTCDMMGRPTGNQTDVARPEDKNWTSGDVVCPPSSELKNVKLPPGEPCANETEVETTRKSKTCHVCLQLLVNEAEVFLNHAEEEIASVSKAANRCELYFGVAGRAAGGGGAAGASLFPSVVELLSAFRSTWQEVHRDEKWAAFLGRK